MSLYLSKSDLAILTGFKQRKKQIAYLKKHRILHRVDGHGCPVVRSEDAELSVAPPSEKAYNAEPNWDNV